MALPQPQRRFATALIRWLHPLADVDPGVLAAGVAHFGIGLPAVALTTGLTEADRLISSTRLRHTPGDRSFRRALADKARAWRSSPGGPMGRREIGRTCDGTDAANVELIVWIGTPATLAAQTATRTLPIVMVSVAHNRRASPGGSTG